MTDTQSPPTGAAARAYRRRSRILLVAFIVVFSAFIANVLVGKAQVAGAWAAPFLLNDVGEYLLLLAAALLFTLTALTRERLRQLDADDAGDQQPQ